ncbi:MAG: hypothetical protein ACRDKG_16005 [Actinomycetota bacterium]
MVGGLVAILVGFAFCAGLVSLGHATFPGDDEGAPKVFRQYLPKLHGGAVTFFAFQRVPTNLRLRETTREPIVSRFQDPERADVKITVSPLGGLLVVGGALAIGGAVAWRFREGGDTVTGMAARMAVVVSLASLGGSFILPQFHTALDPDVFGRRTTLLSYEPSHLGAFVWPFIWTFLFGALGMHVARRDRARRERLGSSEGAPQAVSALRAAISGLRTGAALVLLALLLAAGVGIARNPSIAAEVFGSSRNVAGVVEGVVLGGPHAIGAGLLGSMGIPAKFGTTMYDPEEPPTGGSVSIIGGEVSKAEGSLGVAVPRYALGGLAIAAIFTLATGYRAAAVAGSDRRRALRAALLAAAFLSMTMWILGYLVGGSGRMITGTIELQTIRASAGVSPWAAIALPVVWSVGGGLIGAMLRVRISRTAERRAPPRLSLQPLVIGALVTLLAVGSGAFVSAQIVDRTPSVSEGRPGWNVYRDPANGWTLEFPESWHAQPVSEQRGGFRSATLDGVVISNLDRPFDFLRDPDGRRSFQLDMRGLPTGAVVAEVAFQYSGGFTGASCTNTPLPLSLDDAEREVTRDGAGGTEQTHLRLQFIAQYHPLYFVAAWIGSEATDRDLDLLDQIVGSISFAEAPPGRLPDVAEGEPCR